MRTLVFISIFGFLSLCNADAGDRELVKKELTALRGKWNVVKGAAEDYNVNTQFQFVEDRLWIDIGGNVGQFTIRVNPAKKPKEIDMVTITSDGSDRVVNGIYKLEGTTLEVCFVDVGKKRPSEFRRDSKQTLYVLKRE